MADVVVVLTDVGDSALLSLIIHPIADLQNHQCLRKGSYAKLSLENDCEVINWSGKFI